MGPARAAPAVLEDVAAVAVAVAVPVLVLEVVGTVPVVAVVDVRVVLVEEDVHVSPPSIASQNASAAGLTTSREDGYALVLFLLLKRLAIEHYQATSIHHKRRRHNSQHCQE